MVTYDEYLLDDEVNIIHYANGRPVRLEDFDQEPSARSYAEAKKRPYKELVQMMLDGSMISGASALCGATAMLMLLRSSITTRRT